MPKMERVGDSEASEEDISFWIKELYKQALLNHDFTPWETGFISSVKQRVDGGLPPSELQTKALRDLYNRTFKSIGHKA